MSSDYTLFYWGFELLGVWLILMLLLWLGVINEKK
jgi:hypothetical protein